MPSYSRRPLCRSLEACVDSNCQKRHDVHRCVCDAVMPRQSIDDHLAGKKHALRMKRQPKKQLIASMQTILDDAESNKNGVTVSGESGVIDFGVIETKLGVRVAKSVAVNIQKDRNEGNITLVEFRMTSSVSQNLRSRSFSATLLGKSRWINHGQPSTIMVAFQASHEGHFDDTLELTFEHCQTRQRFAIIRRLRAIVGSNEDRETLKPSAPYKRRKYVRIPLEGRIISETRPSMWSETKWAVSLPEYKMPRDLIKAASSQDGLELVKAKFMPAFFTEKTYGRHFQVMLHIEEEKRALEMEEFTMTEAELIPNPPRYNLEVPGLAEGRPSVLVGDYILVQHHGETNWYKGRVHEVSRKQVSLRFSSDFSTYRGTKFTVRFELNRMPLRRMHQAVTSNVNPARLLFPRLEHIKGKAVTHADLTAITPINRWIGEDEEQLLTVASILHQPPGSVPFVIFGPPGTGKTVTVVEAIRQLLAKNPEARILACAPSNSAADLIAQKLLVLGATQLFRLNSASREYRSLPTDLRDFSLVNGDHIFSVPPLERMMTFRVIVSTCISGGMPYGIGMPRGHFNHIFIDEAGQAMEPEVMVPIKTMADGMTNTVFAGDIQQLGPIVRSSVSMGLGLWRSYLARIMACDIYNLQEGKGLTVVKLLKNFRSHAAILEFPNENFYNGELKPCGDPVITHSLRRCDILSKGFPIVFHGIVGKDMQEASSPSFFNIDEATLVKKYCIRLLDDRKLGIRVEHIGIITPYHAQRCKISRILTGKLQGIKVGSVEEFQGQERRIIIMSTVRSSTEYITYDIKHTLGFVANSRRFNVAITRAQALLVVIGNPDVLSLDPLWRKFLNYIHKNGGWKGVAITWDPEEAVLPGGYDSGVQQRAETEVEAMMARLKSVIVENSENLAMVYLNGNDDGDGYLDGFGRVDE